MIDPALVRSGLKEVDAATRRRGTELDIKRIQALEEERRFSDQALQEANRQRNEIAKKIGRDKASGGDSSELHGRGRELAERLGGRKQAAEQARTALMNELALIPNLADPSVPDGFEESENVEVRVWGEPPKLDFKPRDHTELPLSEPIDFAAAAALSGSRFAVLRGQLARLHRGLIQFMLDLHTKKHGYVEVAVPFLARPEILYGTGQLPKFAEDLFHVGDGHDFYLIPTAEVQLTNLVREQILEAGDLPMKMVAHTACFRSEAGSYGRDTRGMIRQHQFEKVELVWIARPEDSWDLLEQLTGHAEAVLQALELPYRVVTLCAGDLGFAAAKTYDIEVWMPAQECYREISSCSNCTDFQARRMRARWRDPEDGQSKFVHSLNGSGVAAGRAMIALLENHQQADGTVVVPEALRPFVDGLERIGG